MGNTQTAPILIAKFGWDESETRLYNSLIGNSGLLGLMVGSIFGGGLITKGRRRAILLMNILIYIGASFTLVRTLATILIGRFICGFAAGIFQMCSIKSIFETVPEKHCGVFGSLTNIFLNFGGLFCVVLGMAVPQNEEDYADDQMWRLSYAFPMVLSTLQIVLLLAVFKWEPIDFSIKAGQDEKALQFIAKVYTPARGSQEPKEEVFKKFLQLRR